MKGIILAGGSGTRLHPIRGVSKQLLPIYDKPMIYYPLSVLMWPVSAKFSSSLRRKIKVISSACWAMVVSWIIRWNTPNSPARHIATFIIGETFLNGEPSCLVLGDNIFFSWLQSEAAGGVWLAPKRRRYLAIR
ncbi:sugar phosphate nucleotidyltransferase [Escherichia coli]